MQINTGNCLDGWNGTNYEATTCFGVLSTNSNVCNGCVCMTRDVCSACPAGYAGNYQTIHQFALEEEPVLHQTFVPCVHKVGVDHNVKHQCVMENSRMTHLSVQEEERDCSRCMFFMWWRLWWKSM